MSTYITRMTELTALVNKDKSRFYKKISEYKKSKSEVQNALDNNADTLFQIELENSSEFSEMSLKYLKNIYVIQLVFLVLVLLGIVIQVLYLFFN